MYNLSDINTIKKIISRHGFSFKKSMGQNFLTDDSVCPAMAEHCEGQNVLEIGPGIGVLTVQLAQRAKKVVSIELDRSLEKILADTLSHTDNATVVYGDVMKLDLKKLLAEHFGDEPFTVCANLPYNITSPVIMMLLEGGFNLQRMVLMVQKEAAERICAKVGSRNAGAITVSVAMMASSRILFDVDRSGFVPQPNVDSAVMLLDILEKPPVCPKDMAKFRAVVKAGFAQRRKTLRNSLSSICADKANLDAALQNAGISPTARIEELSLAQIALLSDNL